MARDLRVRLVLTYCGVSLAALVLIGSVFTAVLASSASAVHGADLRAETSSLARQLDRALADGASRGDIQRLIRRDSALLGKRIILLNRHGQARYDSARWTSFSRGKWRMVDIGALRHGRWAYLHGLGRIGLQSPLFVQGHEVGAVALVITAADSGVPWRDLVSPLIRVLLALFAVWLVVALMLARSLSRPLRRIGAGLTSVKDGKYDRAVPEEGWSEARRLARRYNEMVAEVARSRQTQRDFVANAAHELKTPIALVAGFARSLADGTAASGGAADDAVNYIQKESEHLARIVDQLFALASLDADVEVLTCSPCHPEDILRQAVDRFSWRAHGVGTTVDVECSEALPLCQWDHEWIASALANLLANALEHSERIKTIRTRAFRSGSAIVFEVEDSGEGIRSEDLAHIFDRFYRAGSRRADGHAGLGLSLVREVVQRHAGTIEVRSQLGSGSCFTLTLPIDGPGHQPSAGTRRSPEISA